MIQILNQLYEMQAKLLQLNVADQFNRNIARMMHECEENGYSMHNPMGEKYADSRTDCDANIVGKIGANMQITQVIKPIIYHTINGTKAIVQKGIVMVESK